MSESQRLVWLDALRGAALFGIAQINFPAFATGNLPVSALFAPHGSSAERLVAAAVTVFVTAKFYPLFAFLFGYGHALQRHALMQQGVNWREYLRRRYAWLLVVGMVHGTLLFFGDILTMYALAGFLLLATEERVSPQVRLLVFAVTTVVVVALDAGLALRVPMADGASQYDLMRAQILEVEHGSLSDIVTMRAGEYLTTQLELFGEFLPQLLMFMSAGVLAANAGVWQAPERHVGLFRGLLLAGVLLGLPINLFFAASTLQMFDSESVLASAGVYDLLGDLAWVLTLGYLGLVGLYAAGHEGSPGWLTRAFAAVGRFALTNYIGQSLAMCLVWYGGARLLMGTSLYLALAAIALGVCLVQAVVSVRLDQKHLRGPLETAWRRFSRQG